MGKRGPKVKVVEYCEPERTPLLWCEGCKTFRRHEFMIKESRGVGNWCSGIEVSKRQGKGAVIEVEVWGCVVCGAMRVWGN
jgi:hypothetical protein